MGQKTSYLEQALLAHSFGQTLWTPPPTWFVVASTEAFDPTLDGGSVVEPTDSAYARLAIGNDSGNFSAPAGSSPCSIQNLLAWTFPSATADWGAILSVYLGDSASGGYLCYGTAVAGDGVPITSGSTFSVPPGAFLVRET